MLRWVRRTGWRLSKFVQGNRSGVSHETRCRIKDSKSGGSYSYSWILPRLNLGCLGCQSAGRLYRVCPPREEAPRRGYSKAGRRNPRSRKGSLASSRSMNFLTCWEYQLNSLQISLSGLNRSHRLLSTRKRNPVSTSS